MVSNVLVSCFNMFYYVVFIVLVSVFEYVYLFLYIIGKLFQYVSCVFMCCIFFVCWFFCNIVLLCCILVISLYVFSSCWVSVINFVYMLFVSVWHLVLGCVLILLQSCVDFLYLFNRLYLLVLPFWYHVLFLYVVCIVLVWLWICFICCHHLSGMCYSVFKCCVYRLILFKLFIRCCFYLFGILFGICCICCFYLLGIFSIFFMCIFYCVGIFLCFTSCFYWFGMCLMFLYLVF